MTTDRGQRKYLWVGGSILALAATNILVTIALIFFDYGAAIETADGGNLPSRSPLLTFLFYVFAPVIAFPTRMGWPLPGGNFAVLINAVLWATGVYFVALGVGSLLFSGNTRAMGTRGQRKP